MKTYEEPVIEIIEIETQDVISTSNYPDRVNSLSLGEWFEV